MNSSFKTICVSLGSLVNELKNLTSEVKKLEKRVNKELKEARRSKKSKKSLNQGDKPKRAPSGFAKPSNISEELCQFLGRPLGTQMARTEVTKHVTQYIKDKGLQNPENKRHILPDQKLAGLLNSNDQDEVTYFNLQKYMKHHFPSSKSQQQTA
jgi:upstream activation factor subunit UAF30